MMCHIKLCFSWNSYTSYMQCQVGNPEVPVVGFAGDGAFGISINELTACGRGDWQGSPWIGMALCWAQFQGFLCDRIMAGAALGRVLVVQTVQTKSVDETLIFDLVSEATCDHGGLPKLSVGCGETQHHPVLWHALGGIRWFGLFGFAMTSGGLELASHMTSI